MEASSLFALRGIAPRVRSIPQSGCNANPYAEPTRKSTPPPWPTWDGRLWWKQLASAQRSLLVLDYDGTLAPFVKERAEAAMYPGVAERLLRLALQPAVRLVFVSGRQARELHSLLPAGLRAEVWGSHGREQLMLDGSYRVFPPHPEQREQLARFARSLAERGFTSSVESKPGSLALHTRGLTAGSAAELTSLAQELFANVDPAADIEWLPFDGGIELRACGCSKATAVTEILSGESIDTPVAYLGDDLTDDDAFKALTGRGLRVLVREEPRPTLADVWLRPPAELRAFLDGWIEATSHAERGARS